MYRDSELLFATAANAWSPTLVQTNVAPNVTDMSPLGTPIGPGSTANLGRDLGQGRPLWFVVTVTAAVTSAGAPGIQFTFRSAASADLTTTTPVDILLSQVFAKATLVAGYTFMGVLPSYPVGSAGYQRYIGATCIITTAVLTAGTFQAECLLDEQKNQKYGIAFTLDV